MPRRYTYAQVAHRVQGFNCLLYARYLYEEQIRFLQIDGNSTKTKKCQEYQRICEELVQKFESQFDGGTSVQNYTIPDNAVGYSYNKIFGQYLDSSVWEIAIEEPYLLLPHQIRNLKAFFSLVTARCKQLQFIQLTTRSLPEDVSKELVNGLERRDHSVILKIYLNPQSHLRVITLSNGYRIKIDYGLDIYKKWEPSDGRGADKRRCKKTTVEVTKKRTKPSLLKRIFGFLVD